MGDLNEHAKGEALNRLFRWRIVLTNWHLGSRGPDEPGVLAMRDLQEFRLLVRAEVTALIGIVIS